MQHYTVYLIWKLLYMFRVVTPPIIRRANNCIYSVWYLSHRYCYLPPSWKSWNRFECDVGGVSHPQHTQTTVSTASGTCHTVTAGLRHPQPTQTGSNSSTIAAGSNNGVANNRCCRFSCLRSWWWVVLQPEKCRAVFRSNKLCNVGSCWTYIRIQLKNIFSTEFSVYLATKLLTRDFWV